jgi:hypothetical protein
LYDNKTDDPFSSNLLSQKEKTDMERKKLLNARRVKFLMEIGKIN